MWLIDIFRLSKIKEENEQLKSANTALQEKCDTLGITEYCQAKEKTDALEKEATEKQTAITNMQEEISALQDKSNKLEKKNPYPDTETYPLQRNLQKR